MRSIEEFLKNGSKVFRRVAIDPRAVETHIRVADDWARTAEDTTKGPEVRVSAAYNVILQTSLGIVNMLGYRVTSAQGHHVETVEACGAAIGASSSAVQDALILVRLRNDQYDGIPATDKDVRTALDAAKRFREFVEDWVKENAGKAKPDGARGSPKRKLSKP